MEFQPRLSVIHSLFNLRRAPYPSTSPPFLFQEKSCATFSCQGSECFKGQKAVAMCPEGLDFCEVGPWSAPRVGALSCLVNAGLSPSAWTK